MRLSELKNKEIIDVDTGMRLGRIGECEVAFDATSGKLCELLICDESKSFSWFGKTEMKRIGWQRICRISEDFVLVGGKTEGLVDQ